MGEGGYITLVNGTNVAWERVHEHSYQMNSWDFPSRVEAGTTARVYVEWNQGIFKTWSDDSGEVRFRLPDGSEFEIQADAKHGFTLKAKYTGLRTLSHAEGAVVPLGWKHDGNVNFLLAGHSGAYVGSGYRADNWMADFLESMGSAKLGEIAITGSHDAGMSRRTSGTALAPDCATLTQSCDVGEQLDLGTRYFDIRPVISAGKYFTGHYSHVEETTWQGANGQRIAEIVEQVNAFTSNRRELVVLNISKSLNTDVGNNSYRPFDAGEWSGLVNELSQLNDLYMAAPDTKIVDLPVKDLIGQKSAVVVVMEDVAPPGRVAGKGFFPYSSLDTYNKYSDSNSLSHMVEDQLGKMKRNVGSEYFLLSWTLTQDGTQAVTCAMGWGASIKQLANQANDALPAALLDAASRTTPPNVLYTDNIVNSQSVIMAVACNIKAQKIRETVSQAA